MPSIFRSNFHFFGSVVIHYISIVFLCGNKILFLIIWPVIIIENFQPIGFVQNQLGSQILWN